MSKRVGSLIIIALILATIFYGYKYISFREQNAVSDAAFIKSNRLSFLSFKVSGKVVKMYKKEGQSIKKGELLAVIEPKDFLVAKAKLLNEINSTKEAIDALKIKRDRLSNTLKLKSQIAKIDFQSATKKIESLEYKIDSNLEKLDKLKRDRDRYRNILDSNLIAKSNFEKVDTEYKSLKSLIESMQKTKEILKKQQQKAKKAIELIVVSQKEIKELSKSIKSSQFRLKALFDSLKDLENKISYTKLYAPFNGVVAKKFFDAPNIIKAGTPTYAIVDTKDLYCEVLLSEKKLRGVKVGSRAKVTVDAIKGRVYEGVVSSIAPTSASTFSLVPRDIASGEFTKLEQRFKVKIKLNSTKDLRVGMGAGVAIKRD